MRHIGRNFGELIDRHEWGKSAYLDQVWSAVSGMALSSAHKVGLMALQAFIDESYDDDGLFVMGGFVASYEARAAFSQEWEALLPRFGILGKSGKYHFHMTEMMMLPERRKRIRPFFNVIQDNIVCAISASINLTEFRRAIESISLGENNRLKWGLSSDPYYFTFRILMEAFHRRRSDLDSILTADERVDFVFDKHSSSNKILRAWIDHTEAMPEEERKLYGSTPRFEDDDDFLPLQAADFLAYLMRVWEKGDLQSLNVIAESSPGGKPRGFFGATQHVNYRKLQQILARGVRADSNGIPVLISDVDFNFGSIPQEYVRTFLRSLPPQVPERSS